MLLSNVARFVSQTVLGLLLVSGHAQIWQLVVLRNTTPTVEPHVHVPDETPGVEVEAMR
jgi:hypothetical protein